MRRPSQLLGGLLLLACTAVYVLALVLFASTGAEAGTTRPTGYVLLTGFQVFSFFAFPVVGSLIVTQRPGNVVGWVFCLIGLGTATTALSGGYVQHALAIHAEARLATGLVYALGNAVWPVNLGLGSLLLFIFPDGRLPSPRWRPVFWLDVACIVAMALAGALYPGALDATSSVANPIGIAGLRPLLDVFNAVGHLLFGPLVLAAMLSVIVRYRRATGAQRQQIKWFVYGATLMVAAIAASIVLAQVLTPAGQDSSNSPIVTLGFCIGWIMLPIGAGIGVLRYRLYDIDILINRTLVYGALSAVLAALYLACVIGAQTVTSALSGQAISPELTGQMKSQPVVVVGSTLLIASLFNPLRRRIQATIDRRFYRRKYDATRTLEGFAAVLRSETDLGDLSSHLVAVVEQTMQPAQVSLWLHDLQRSAIGANQQRGDQ